jgi:hypothetical protein
MCRSVHEVHDELVDGLCVERRMVNYLIPVEGAEPFPSPYAFLKIVDDWVVFAVLPNGREVFYDTQVSVTREEKAGLWREVSELEAIGRLTPSPGSDRPSSSKDPW